MREWHLYLVRTARGALYTGITTDVARRVGQHARGAGAKALRARGPLTLVYQVALGERGCALRAEHAIKRLGKAHKELLVTAQFDAPALIASLGLKLPPLTRVRRRRDWSDS